MRKGASSLASPNRHRVKRAQAEVTSSTRMQEVRVSSSLFLLTHFLLSPFSLFFLFLTTLIGKYLTHSSVPFAKV